MSFLVCEAMVEIGDCLGRRVLCSDIWMIQELEE